VTISRSDAMSKEELGRALGHVLAKALVDDSFRQTLLSDLVATLKAEGVELPASLEVRVVQNADNLLFVGLPTTSSRELSDKELGDVAGGEPAHPMSSSRLVSTNPVKTSDTSLSESLFRITRFK
jgi:hypothetical protein